MNALICRRSVLVLNCPTGMVLVIKVSFDFCVALVIRVSMSIEVSWIWPQYESRSKQKLGFVRGSVRMWNRQKQMQGVDPQDE